MHYSKYLIIFLTVFLPAKLFAQDITGLWKGTLYNDTTQKYYRYEIGISEEKGKLSGFSHTFFLVGDKEYYGVKKVKVKRTDGKIIVEDNGLIANNYPEAPAKGVKQLNVLTLEIKDSLMTLSGPFSTNRTKEYSSLTGTIFLQRKNDFRQSALVPHLQELGRSEELSFVKAEVEKEAAEKIAMQKEKEEKEKIALQKEIAAKEAVKQKEKELAKATVKEKEPAKEIASNSKQPKKEETKEVKPIAVKETEPAKEQAPNSSVAKNEQEEKPVEIKESNTVTPKEIAVNNKTEKKEQTAAIKSSETKQQVVSKETATVPVKEEKPVVMRSTAPAAEVTNRINVIQQTVYFSADSLQLSLYDNGEVDGDTVSVLMNGKVIMAKEGLSTNAVRKTIFPGNADSVELVMYAENLGAIAPNTGLLVVHDGKSIYEIRFSGDLKKNASIILRRRKS